MQKTVGGLHASALCRNSMQFSIYKGAIVFAEHNSSPTRKGENRAKTNISRFALYSLNKLRVKRNMRYCPECGGDMQYAIATKHYICKSCGLSVTQQELWELREKLRPNMESAEEERQKHRKEYLKWWLSKKK
jgi:tRNA(Ile2) C34 agmatinyltransferase TiaS